MSAADGNEKRFAFFDLDLTLVPFDTQLVFCNFVMRREPWRLFYLLFFLPCLPFYAIKLIGDAGLKRVFLCQLWRMPRAKLERYAADFAAEICPGLFFEEMVREVERHREEGRITVLNTASPVIYAEAIATLLGFDHCFATRVRVGERVPFFPKIEGSNNKGEAKIDAMRAILPEGAGPPYADSYAYSDSSADLPLLRLAEHAVMVHPSAKLRRAGEESGWEEKTPARPYGGDAGRWWAMALQLLGWWRAKE